MSRSIGFFGQNYIASSGFDVDAENYINEVLSTGATLTSGEQITIDNFFRGLKNDGLYTLLDRIYPFLGGNSASNAVEMKAPGTNDLVFNGNWTHTATGSIADNSTTVWAETSFNIGTTGVTNVIDDFSFGLIQSAIIQKNIGYSGAGPSGHFVILGHDYGLGHLDNFYNSNQEVSVFSYAIAKGGYLNSLWRDSASTWRTGYKLNGTTASTGIEMAATFSSSYTRRTGLNTLRLNNRESGPNNDEGRYSFGWIGRYMDETQRTNYLIRINDLLQGFNNNIFI